MAIVFKYFQFAELLFMICSKRNQIESAQNSFKQIGYILFSCQCPVNLHTLCVYRVTDENHKM